MPEGSQFASSQSSDDVVDLEGHVVHGSMALMAHKPEESHSMIHQLG